MMKSFLYHIFIIIFFFLVVAIFDPPVYAAQFILKSSETSVVIGKTFTVTINLTGGEPTLGTDMVLSYDKDRLVVTKVQASSLYPTYNPVGEKRIDQENGVVTLSGSGGIGKTVPAEGEFATITFKAIKPGQATIVVDYTPGETNKSGIIDPKGAELMSVSPSPIILVIKDQSPLQKIFAFFTALFQKK